MPTACLEQILIHGANEHVSATCKALRQAWISVVQQPALVAKHIYLCFGPDALSNLHRCAAARVCHATGKTEQLLQELDRLQPFTETSIGAAISACVEADTGSLLQLLVPKSPQYKCRKALFLAVKLNKLSAAKAIAITDPNADLDYALLDAFIDGSVEMAELLISLGGSPWIHNGMGLFSVVKEGSLEKLKAFLRVKMPDIPDPAETFNLHESLQRAISKKQTEKEDLMRHYLQRWL